MVNCILQFCLSKLTEVIFNHYLILLSLYSYRQSYTCNILVMIKKTNHPHDEPDASG